MTANAAIAKTSNNVRFTNIHAETHNDVADIIASLSTPQKTLEPKFFYDSLGSQLFEDITQTAEYYPTRTERKILWDNRHEIASATGTQQILIEPGSGSSEKVRLLLDALQPEAYVPLDIADDFLLDAALKLSDEFNWLDIHALCADFNQIQQLPENLPNGERLIFYPGSTLGNMTPTQAEQFLTTLHHWLIDESHHSGGVLIGIDLHKDANILNAAYNDAAGITAAFNLNALNNVNRIAGTEFDTTKFEHHAFYNQSKRRIEMHLICLEDHSVNIGEQTIHFTKGETIHTENSYKYTLESFEQLVNRAGFTLQQSWLDEAQLFSFHYLKAA